MTMHRTIIMRIAATAVLLLLCTGTVPAQQDECYNCHSALDDEPSQGFVKDVHRRAGLTCAACHGGAPTEEDMEIAMSAARGFIGVPAKENISQSCGGCHNDAEKMQTFGYTGSTGQLDTLLQSAHARGTDEDAQLLLQCTDCHGAHGIRSPDDPSSRVSRVNIVEVCSSCHSDPTYMRRYNPALPTDQRSKYRTSVHGQLNLRGDPYAASCADCHTAHDINPAEEATSSVHPLNIPATCSQCHADSAYMAPYDIPTDQLTEYRRSVHGKALLEKRDLNAPVCNDCHGNHAAVPPNVESISNVCGTCHALNAELFRDSRHASEFREMGYPECETCHGNHDVEPATKALLRFGENTLCGRCHSESLAPEGYREGRRMRTLLDSLMMTIEATEASIDAAEQKGMEIDDIRFSLRDARQARLRSRTAVHEFSLDKFREVIDPGLVVARKALHDAKEANDEYYYRRYGLAVATLIITVLVILLFLYIRRIERRNGGEASAGGPAGQT